MKRTLSIVLSAATAISILTGCGGSDSNIDAPEDREETPNKIHTLSKQTGTGNYLFFGEVDPKSMGTLANTRVIGSEEIGKISVKNDDTSDVRYAALETQVGTFDADSMAYTDMHVETLSYVSGGKAYVVPMTRVEGKKPAPQQNSSAVHLSDAGYTKVNYLGVKQYLVAHDDDADTIVLITPQMGPNDAPLDIGDRKLLSVTFPKYGDKIDGYLFYNYANI